MKKMLLGIAVLVVTAGFTLSDANAQSVTPEWAAPLMGSWSGMLVTPDGTVPILINVRNADGNVVVVLGGEDGESDPITRVSRSGEALVARYDMDYQGMPINAEIRMELDGEELDTDWSFADGMYTTSTRATKQ